jgi:TPR repeat protein
VSNPLDEYPTRADQDQAEATQLYRLAAEQGMAGAQYRLGVMYAEGQGMAQDDRESVRWFRLAAEPGNAEAQAGLGLAYGASTRGLSVEGTLISVLST